MANEALIGTPWSDEELDLIVADYLAMLRHELTGTAYVKAHHAKSLMAMTGRTHRSVEFKHMNISAVLRELSMPTIRGYRPKPNYQNAIFDAIERALQANPWLLDAVEPTVIEVAEGRALFEENVPSLADAAKVPAKLERLVRKFDPVERDRLNRSLGLAGEELAFEHERRRLFDAGCEKLAKDVRWVSKEEGDGAGYDILSFDLDGRSRLIEVKTTNGSQRTPFFLSRNEESLSRERPAEFQIFRIYDFSRAPRAFRIDPPLTEHVRLEAESYRASFG